MVAGGDQHKPWHVKEHSSENGGDNGCYLLDVRPQLRTDRILTMAVIGQTGNLGRVSSTSGGLIHLDFTGFLIHSASVCLWGAWVLGDMRTSA